MPSATEDSSEAGGQKRHSPVGRGHFGDSRNHNHDYSLQSKPLYPAGKEGTNRTIHGRDQGGTGANRKAGDEDRRGVSHKCINHDSGGEDSCDVG